MFNLRGAIETARYFAPKQPVVTLSAIHAKALQRPEATRLAARHALSRVISALGGSASAEQLRTQTVGGLPLPEQRDARRDVAGVAKDQTVERQKLPVSPVNLDEQQKRADRSVGRERETPVVSAEDRRSFEARRDAALERIEAEQKIERRRRRARPRGKTRRME